MGTRTWSVVGAGAVLGAAALTAPVLGTDDGPRSGPLGGSVVLEPTIPPVPSAPVLEDRGPLPTPTAVAPAAPVAPVPAPVPPAPPRRLVEADSPDSPESAASAG